MSPRYPFTSFPRGWYQVAYSDELAPGAVLPLRCFGQDLVLFRAEGGQAAVLDAHCPHLGAHLGHGGRVRGECIECPFHGWRINAHGRCSEIPHAEKIPPDAFIRAWEVQEVNGLILVSQSPPGEALSWHVPTLAEHGSPEWTPFQKRHWRIRTHVFEISENVVDPTHFRYVHQTLSIPETRVESEGPLFRSRSSVMQPTPRGPVQGQIDGEAHGPGFWAIRFTGIVDLMLITAATPIDDDFIDLRLSFTVRRAPVRGAEQKVGDALIAEITHQVDEDVPIWEHKIYRAKPLFSAGDGAISALRKWNQQFVPSPSPQAPGGA